MKTVEILIVNDAALFGRQGEETEALGTQIFNAMAGFYGEGSGFDCELQLRLVGQLTFRAAMPAQIEQRQCDLPWYHAGVATAANNRCCAAVGLSILWECPIGLTDCVELSSGCDGSAGCYQYQTNWVDMLGSRRNMLSQERVDGACKLSTSPHELDHHLMLRSLGTWLEANHAALQTVFAGQIDAVMLFSGLDFASRFVGLAGIGTMCGATVAHSVVQVCRP